MAKKKVSRGVATISDIADEVLLPEMMVYKGDKLYITDIKEIMRKRSQYMPTENTIRGMLSYLVGAGELLHFTDPSHPAPNKREWWVALRGGEENPRRDVWSVRVGGKDIGIKETNYPYASKYWDERARVTGQKITLRRDEDNPRKKSRKRTVKSAIPWALVAAGTAVVVTFLPVFPAIQGDASMKKQNFWNWLKNRNLGL